VSEPITMGEGCAPLVERRWRGARALFKLELDTEIPAEHYQAVAEIIAYVWRLRGRAGAAA
jgi:type III secretion system FlhB-like substrate exporter